MMIQVQIYITYHSQFHILKRHFLSLGSIIPITSCA